VTNQLRANSGAMVEIVDVVPLLMQNIDGAINKEKGLTPSRELPMPISRRTDHRRRHRCGVRACWVIAC
ncbi:hypothetical protein, partial [Nocardia fluminea]|uniref:hypothetical protein n=1 Tax=Nocardia fluminea TaxID=134984 RepID=UPI003D0AB2C1